MDLDSDAGLLHRLTSYAPDRESDVPVDDPRVRHDLVPNDLATRPPATKAYWDLPVVPLPRELPDPGVSASPGYLATLVFTCVGVPEDASRRGGGSGASTKVRIVQPRLTEGS